jgi:hypothetical protein
MHHAKEIYSLSLRCNWHLVQFKNTRANKSLSKLHLSLIYKGVKVFPIEDKFWDPLLESPLEDVYLHLTILVLASPIGD